MKFWVLALAAALLFSAGESVTHSPLNQQKARCDGNIYLRLVPFHKFFPRSNFKCLFRWKPQLSPVCLQSARRRVWALCRGLQTRQERLCCCQVPQITMWVTSIEPVKNGETISTSSVKEKYQRAHAVTSHGQRWLHVGTNLLMSMLIFWRPVAQFQKCMSLESCNLLKLNAYINVKCCGDDMCNTFWSRDGTGTSEEMLPR